MRDVNNDSRGLQVLVSFAYFLSLGSRKRNGNPPPPPVCHMLYIYFFCLCDLPRYVGVSQHTKDIEMGGGGMMMMMKGDLSWRGRKKKISAVTPKEKSTFYEMPHSELDEKVSLVLHINFSFFLDYANFLIMVCSK